MPIEMVGVWDTVKATNDEDYDDNRLAPNVLHGYHAMAIDERRKPFPVLKWRKERRVLEVWFAGVHSDVGGGYEAAGLADVALRWMMGRRFAVRRVRDRTDFAGLAKSASYLDSRFYFGFLSATT